MQIKKITLALILSACFAITARGAETYVIDPANSHIGFSVRHLVINTVHGRFTEFSGTIIYDEQDITKSSVEVTIKTASINSDQNDRDNHLRSADFFDAAKYPEITFKSARIEKRGDGMVAVGTLTMHGVSKEVAIGFHIGGKANFHGSRLGVEGGLAIDRRDFGISWSGVLDNGGLVVGNEVKIVINVEAVKK